MDDVKNCDRYVESVGDSEVRGDRNRDSLYANLSEWLETLEIELDDATELVLALEAGELVNITDYC